MTLYVQFLLLFFIAALAAVETATGVIILREALKRSGRRFHLFMMAACLLFFGISATSYVFITFIEALESSWTQQAVRIGFTTSQLEIMLASTALMICYITVFIKKQSQKWWYASLALLLLTAMALRQAPNNLSYGIFIPANDLWQFALSYTVWVLVTIASLIVTATYIAKNRKNRLATVVGADRYLLWGSLMHFFAMVSAVLMLILNDFKLAGIVFGLLGAGAIMHFLGANAKHHPDAEIEQFPIRLITRSLRVKTLLVSVLLFVLLATMLIFATSTFFVARYRLSLAHEVDTSAETFNDRLRAEMDNLLIQASSLASFETLRLDDQVSQIPLLQRDVAELVQHANDGGTEISVVGAETIPANLTDSRLIDLALSGQKNWSIEFDQYSHEWIMRAAAPVRDQSGQVVSVAVSGKALTRFLNSNPCAKRLDSAIGGCGILDASDQIVSARGSIDDVATLRSIIVTPNEWPDEIYLASSKLLEDNLNDAVGHVFFYVTAADFNQDILKLTSSIISIMLLASAGIVLLLAYIMSIILRPIRELRTAAEMVSKGDYGHAIQVMTHDEIGQLSGSFNSMSKTIKERTESLEEKMREQKDFLNYIAHELKSPVTVVNWALESAEDCLDNNKIGTIREMIATSRLANNRLGTLIRELLDFARLERGAITLDPKPLSLNKIVNGVVREIGDAAKNNGKKIELHIAKELPDIIADESRLTQILNNLIGNAVKYTIQKGTILVEADQVTHLEPGGKRGKYIQVSVTDSGIGIPAHQQEKIFSKFFRADNAAGSSVEGTGLGLNITKRLIELHEGRIWFKSEENVGSTFTFTLPASRTRPKRRLPTNPRS